MAGDFSGDGRTDLAVANLGSNDVSVLLGNGDGTFQNQVRYPAGTSPFALVAGDFSGDGRTDLAVANLGSNDVSVLLGNGDGTFQNQVRYPAGTSPFALVAGDFSGDGRTDLAVANGGSNDVSVLLGNGDGTFQDQVRYPAGTSPFTLVAGDFSGDGRTDLAVANYGSNDVSVLLSLNRKFAAPGPLAINPHATPLVADVNGDGTNDVLVVDGAGNILYRQGIPGQPGSFEPPVTVNPGNPSRDIAWVPVTDQGPVLASVDATDNAISLYGWRDGTFVRIGSLPTSSLPAQIVSGDLLGDGGNDLVVRNAGDGTLTVFFSNDSGSDATGNALFPSSVTLQVGLGVSDVTLADVDQGGVPDIIVTNKVSGEVGVLRNLGAGAFAPAVLYRAGGGLYGVTNNTDGSASLTTLEATSGVAAGAFTRGGPPDLLTVNTGSNTLGLLAGLGGGRFANPVNLLTAEPAQVVRVADFNHDGIPDVAVLGDDTVSIYLGNGRGGFSAPRVYNAGLDPTGLTVADLGHDGNLDLLIGNAYGDVLTLAGRGDGTFRPLLDAGQNVALAVADLTGNGTKDIIYASQNLDNVVVDYGGGQRVPVGASSGLLAPGAIAVADLNGDGIPDLIVANSGGNNVLVYPGLGNGQFGPALNGGKGFFTGTDPVGVTVADLNGRPDLVVANRGSNDVTILLNQATADGGFTFVPGPRLNLKTATQQGIGPVATAIVPSPTGGPSSLAVSLSGSNQVWVIPGVGGGFFNDRNPTIYDVGSNPGPILFGNFDGKPDLVTVNAGSNDLTLISDFLSADAVTTTISSGGTDPAAAFSFSAGSGFDDLVIGNGDGVLALFEGSDQGLTLTSSEINPDLPSPSALVYAGLAGGDVQFYAASAGREAAVLIALSLGGEIAPLSPPTPSPTPTVAQLVPLQESSLALVGTFLITTLPSSATEVNLGPAETDVATTVALTTAGPVALGQGVAGPSHGGETGTGGDEPSAQPEPAKPGAEPADASWQQRALGTDEALERFDREHPDLSRPRNEDPETNPSRGHGSIPAPAQENPPLGQATPGRRSPAASGRPVPRSPARRTAGRW